jgi:hypothetical protein
VQRDVIAERAHPAAPAEHAHARQAPADDEQRRAGNAEGDDDQQRAA